MNTERNRKIMVIRQGIDETNRSIEQKAVDDYTNHFKQLRQDELHR